MADKVCILQHLHINNDGSEDIKLIGVYSSNEYAIKAIERLNDKPGFKDSRLIDVFKEDLEEGFYIDKYEIDEDHWVEGFISVDCE